MFFESEPIFFLLPFETTARGRRDWQQKATKNRKTAREMDTGEPQMESTEVFANLSTSKRCRLEGTKEGEAVFIRLS